MHLILKSSYGIRYKNVFKFFYRKHLSTDRGGMILLDNKEDGFY